MEKNFRGDEKDRIEVHRRAKAWIVDQGDKIEDTLVSETIVRKSSPGTFRPKVGSGELTVTVRYKRAGY